MKFGIFNGKLKYAYRSLVFISRTVVKQGPFLYPREPIFI